MSLPTSMRQLHLAIERMARHAPQRHSQCAADRRMLWDLLCPPGSLIRYYPVWGQWNVFQLCTLRRAAEVIEDNPVLWLDEVSGFVLAWHCEPACCPVGVEPTNLTPLAPQRDP